MATEKLLTNNACNELISLLSKRFAKTCTAIRSLSGQPYCKSSRTSHRSFGRSAAWKPPGASPMLLLSIRPWGNTSIATVRTKALPAAEAYATTTRRWTLVKQINLPAALLAWPPKWALVCSQRSNITSYKYLGRSIPKHRAG